MRVSDLISGAVVALLLLAPAVHAGDAARFTPEGALVQPENYREWVFIGATVAPNDINFGSAYAPGIKHTYMDPESFAHWKSTGAFRTGTIIVQERLAEERSEFMNAEGYFAGKYLGLQAMVKDAVRFPESVWGFFSFGGPPYAEAVHNVPGMGELDCAGCHTRADHDWVFTRFYPMLTAAAPTQSEGKTLFERDWTPAVDNSDNPHATQMGDGLGPLFHTQSCNACHPSGDRGKFTFRSDGVIEGDGLLLKVGAGKSGDPIYGKQIQTRAIKGLKAEGIPAVRFEQVRHSTGQTLRKPTFELRGLAYGAISPGIQIAGRIAQSVKGNGGLEKVPDEHILAHADPDDVDGDGISGRPNEIELSMGGTAIGRFGWKAGQWSLKIQTAKAFRMDMGMSSPLMGPAWGDCTPVQTECHELTNGEHPRKGGREVSAETLEKVTEHVAALPPPSPRGYNAEGEKVFTDIGCAACHIKSLPLSGGGHVNAFTDLLLHDMGPGLADGIEEGSATGSEWRTAPLMDLGKTMAAKAPLLHDGRARNADEAILWHGGEAERVVGAYTQLPKTKLNALLNYLGTL